MRNANAIDVRFGDDRSVAGTLENVNHGCALSGDQYEFGAGTRARSTGYDHAAFSIVS
jgi:hypothetical protein